MSDLNNVTLMGRLVRDAEVRQTSSGKNCALFSMVVNRTKKENDQYVQTPHFFNLALFGSRSQGLLPYLKKGQLIVVEGHLEQRQWEKDGEKRSGTEIVVEEVHLAGYKKSETDNCAQTSSDGIQSQVSSDIPQAQIFTEDIEVVGNTTADNDSSNFFY